MLTFADRFLHFLQAFPLPASLPGGASALSPYREPEVFELLQRFAGQFYADNQPRVAVLGINPGRFGGGRTGVAFTDPVALAQHCGIRHSLPLKRPEISSQFVYAVIAALGGPAVFYQHFYLGSLYPLVLLRESKNYNYYDAPALTQALWPDLQLSLRQQVQDLPLRRDVAVCLGRRNALFFERLNEELRLFDRIQVLDHPRHLMQYHRRALPANIAHYVQVLGDCLSLPA